MPELDNRITGQARDYVINEWPKRLLCADPVNNLIIAINAANFIYAYIEREQVNIDQAADYASYNFIVSENSAYFIGELILADCWPNAQYENPSRSGFKL